MIRINLTDKTGGLSALLAKLEVYGDIMGFERAKDSAVIVSYSDLGAADRAAAALGSECKRELARGDSSLPIFHNSQLHGADSSDNSDGQDGHGDGFLERIYDVRAASKVASLQEKTAKATATALDGQSGCMRPPPGLARPASRTASHAQLPPQWWAPAAEKEKAPPTAQTTTPERSERSSDGTEDEHQGAAARIALVLKGLPAQMCQKSVMGLVLEKAGLAQSVVDIQVLTVKGKLGSVQLTASSPSESAKIVRTFHGRMWSSTIPVSVSLSANRVSRGANSAAGAGRSARPRSADAVPRLG